MRNFIKNISLLALCGFLLYSCGSAKNRISEEEIANLVEQRQFNIESTWATPLGGLRINLIGNPNYVKFNKDSVDLFLPYFGFRQMGGGYGSESGIKYKGRLKELKIDKPKENKYQIKFQGAHLNESFDFIISVYSNGNTNISVNSSQRNTISYQGELEALDENE